MAPYWGPTFSLAHFQAHLVEAYVKNTYRVSKQVLEDSKASLEWRRPRAQCALKQRFLERAWVLETGFVGELRREIGGDGDIPSSTLSSFSHFLYVFLFFFFYDVLGYFSRATM